MRIVEAHNLFTAMAHTNTTTGEEKPVCITT